MKILYVVPETPFTGGGGIATYLRHSIDALTNAGHEVHVLTWVYGTDHVINLNMLACLPAENTRVLHIEGPNVWKQYPNGPWMVALSHYLVPYIVQMIDAIQPDIIETSDYCAPLFGFLTQRRAGLLQDSEDIPVLTFNHGLQREIYRVDARFVDVTARQELAVERMALRWSDGVLVPSEAALSVLQRQVGAIDHAIILREPYVCAAKLVDCDIDRSRYTFLGRVSISKGIDHVIHFLNVAHQIRPIDEIVLIGREINTTFKIADIRNYIRLRAQKGVYARMNFKGAVPHADIDGLLEGGGYSLNFSEQETFNYAFLEQLDCGLIPLTLDKTPMAEFFPSHLRSLLIPSNFSLAGLDNFFATVAASPNEILAAIRENSQALTHPSRFAANYERICYNIKDNKGNKKTGSWKRYNQKKTCSDVTILMPVYNPGAYTRSAVGSALSQTLSPYEIIILDDGSSAPESVMILNELNKHPQVRVVHSISNEGLCSTRCKLINECKTDLAIFLDDDDQIAPQYLEKTLNAFNRSPNQPDAVVTWRQNFGASNELVIKYNMDDYEHFITNDFRMTSLIKTEILASIGFSPSMRNGEADDWDFWLKFKARGFNVICFPEALFLYHFRLGSMSWPWSEGQAALTADLISRNLVAGLERGSVPQDLFLDLLSIVHEARKQPSLATARLNLARRADHIGAIREKRPIVGGLLAMAYRGVTGAAKRLS